MLNEVKLPCALDPTQTANRGAPVQTLTVISAARLPSPTSLKTEADELDADEAGCAPRSIAYSPYPADQADMRLRDGARGSRFGSEQVDGRRGPDGPDHDRVADVALEGEDQRGEGASPDDGQPRGSLQRHASILAQMADTVTQRA